MPQHKSSRNGFVASFENLVETVRKEALEKGAKDEVDDGREASIGETVRWEEPKPGNWTDEQLKPPF